ncbi:MAG: metallophosphoesterase [Terriglobales bacterium]
MKVVIISDLHSNYEALLSLRESYDELWVLGDLVNYGPQPAEIVDFVRSNAAVVVRGNHDNAVGFDVDPRCTLRYREMAEQTRRFTQSTLSEEQKEFLRNLPLTVQFTRGGTRFHLCHAIPSDPLYGYCPENSDRWGDELNKVRADILLVGHTHTPFIRHIGDQVVVNPGSLGQPKTGKADACYALWSDGTIELKQFSYPVEKAVRKLEKLPITPDVRQDLATVLRTGSV